MRILLATAVAIAPLMAATGAMAEVVISTARTTPITTSNATGSTADDINIAAGGSIAVTSGVAVTIDSNNKFTTVSGGVVTMADSANGSTAILVNPGVTTTINIASVITVADSIEEYPDTDKDGDIDGPWATGTGRYGLRLAPGGAVTGDIKIANTGSIQVDGNESYAISIESDLTGNLQSFGTIGLFGDNSVGISTTGDVTGDVQILGKVFVRGENTSAVSIGGDIGGSLVLQGDISASGYHYTARGNEKFEAGLDADDKLQGGPAVIIAGNVAGGVIVDVPPELDKDNADVDGDGIPDSSETIGLISSYGEAPAILVGSDTQSITLGPVGSNDDAYGFINRGTVSGQGVYDNIAANGIVFGGGAGQTVTLAGGFRNQGTITAVAQKADATAVRFGDGVDAPALLNSGTITAGAITDIATDVVAIQIDAGANVTSLENSGNIIATTAGGVANLAAIRDESGGLTSVINRGNIQAASAANAAGDPITGDQIAIDVSANTTGFTYTQVTAATVPDTPAPKDPVTSGDIRLGSGADLIDIQGGTVTGDISFGDGADSLLISGGAKVQSVLTNNDGNLSIDISDGLLDSRGNSQLDLTSLNVGDNGQLIVSIDPLAGTTGTFNVSGTATLADGASLGIRFNTLLAAPTQFDLITAGTLNVGNVDLGSIEANSPYLYVVEAGIDQPNNTIFADVRQRTTAEAGMISSEAGLYDAFYSALGRDEDIRNAFLNQVGRDEFFNLYEQLLPEHSGGPLLSLSSGVDAVTRALTGRNASAAPGETSAWVQEINFYADKDRTDTYGFRSEGFGIAGGVERGTGLGAIGISAAFTSSDLEDPESEAEEVLSASLLELGVYWRAQGQYWTTWARAAAGYASFESERRLVGAGLNLRNEADWNGVSLTAAAGASYERNFGRFSFRPEVYAEYFALNEDGYTETGGGDGFDLQLDDRKGHMFSATAAINIGMAMGDNSWLRPELRLGWRQNISVDPGQTIGRFASGGPDFILDPASVEGGGPLIGLRVNVGNELGMLSVSADAELIDNYVRYMLFLRASFRF
jgi:hypothetical protein